MLEKNNTWFNLSKRDQRRASLFIVCLLLAVGFWLISSFSNKYTFNVNTELILINIPEDKTLNVKNVEAVTLTVQGSGWQLLFSKIDLFKQPLHLDLAKVNDSNIKLMKYAESFNHQMPDGIKIIGIAPVSIDLDFSSRVVKKVPVELLADITFKKQYFYSSNLTLDPDSITISGPFDEISKVKSWSTPKLSLTNLSDSVFSIVKLVDRKTDNIQISPNVISLHIPVEKFTEGLIEIPLSLVNNKENFDVNLLPGKIRIKYLCPISKYALVDEDMFHAQVDLNQWKLQRKNRLDVKMLRSPDFIRVISVQPQLVDFLVTK
ncbi:YbbR-like domain-containing protein [Solitalea lacus]|uniref:CdaR family protein n=1 Tax=Solitalea lacus TaxID=2911172 RepID=UPI001EDC0183|nr:hypothetical protein [Solitalea lacus]UKJ06437.1 hypothetical protein L2B55_12925 [Solitalea lacus]